MVLLTLGWVHLNSLVHNYDFPSRGSRGHGVSSERLGSKEGGLLFVCVRGWSSEVLMVEVTFEVRLKGWEQLMGKCRGKGQGLEGPLHWEWA